jgi:hypothetical protein
MPSFTVDDTKAVKIPADDRRRKLRWRIATTADGGGVTHVSLRANLNASDTAKCGIPYNAGTTPEGETLMGHQADVGKALYFRCPTGVTSKIYWDADKLPETPI